MHIKIFLINCKINRKMTTVRSKVENNRNQWRRKFNRTVRDIFQPVQSLPQTCKKDRLPSCLLHVIKVKVKREKNKQSFRFIWMFCRACVFY